ncbi:MAG: hypothetical protein WAW17_01305 [Rhodococcus sp. (in: high G+C Gram-positive bacteria)]|uniref:hypothetical protein n=1 Tax=Rhodococcus sp. TaxID=1831 RepID=UPI003BB124D8
MPITVLMCAEPLPIPERVVTMASVYWSDADDVLIAERPGRCPGCRHPATAVGGQRWVERFLRLSPLPARCAEIMLMDPCTGLIGFCQCRHHFHGS